MTRYINFVYGIVLLSLLLIVLSPIIISDIIYGIIRTKGKEWIYGVNTKIGKGTIY